MSEKYNIEYNEATLIAYINGELSASDHDMVEHWLTLSADNQNEMDRIKRIWTEAEKVTPVPVHVDTDKALSNVLSQINQSKEIPSIAPKSNFKRIIFSAAAVIIILFGAVSVINFFNESSATQLELTAKNTILEDELPDGTSVSINQNSMLIYTDEFEGKERRVKLTGEAFFDVKRDETKPFIIDLHNDFYVKVLGTSFNINANDEDSLTEVYVKSGKVEFGSDQDKVILVAGETGVMNNSTGKVRKLIDENADIKSLYWKSEELNFDHMKLSTALLILEDVFEVEINLDCQDKLDAQLVSNHEKESLDEILNVISSLHDLTVKKSKLKYTLTCD